MTEQNLEWSPGSCADRHCPLPSNLTSVQLTSLQPPWPFCPCHTACWLSNNFSLLFPTPRALSPTWHLLSVTSQHRDTPGLPSFK